jgi:hypothetical protein
VSGYQLLPISRGGEKSACISKDELVQINPLVFQEKQAGLIMVLRENAKSSFGVILHGRPCMN